MRTTGAVLGDIGKQPPHHIELVVAREDRFRGTFARLWVLLGDDLCIVLDDASSAAFAVGRGRVVQVDVLTEVIEPVAQQVHYATLGDLALQPGEEFVPRGRRLTETERRGELWLRACNELGEMTEVERVRRVVGAGGANLTL